MSSQHRYGLNAEALALALWAWSSVALGIDNSAGKTPPLGWSTWKTCGDAECTHDFCNEEEVKESALAMQQNGMHALGWDRIHLDDCWALARNATDSTLLWDVARFPSGIPALIAWLHARGFQFGLYTSAGNETCSSGGYAPDNAVERA